MIETYEQMRKYAEDKAHQIMKDNRLIFAFNKQQLEEGMQEISFNKETEKLSSLGAGAYIPSDNVKKYLDEMDTLYLEQKALVLTSEKIRDEFITYELANHEAYYCADSYHNAVQHILDYDYGVTMEEIKKVYNREEKNNE